MKPFQRPSVCVCRQEAAFIVALFLFIFFRTIIVALFFYIFWTIIVALLGFDILAASNDLSYYVYWVVIFWPPQMTFPVMGKHWPISTDCIIFLCKIMCKVVLYI